MERRLAAILAADMVGYSKLMAADEAGTIERQKAYRATLIDPKIEQYSGRIVNTTGDGMLIEFPSVVDAVQCAVEIQCAMLERESEVPDSERIRYRVGINLGDIVIEGGDILGDGVNIAARLEALAEPGGISVSRPVHTQIKSKLDLNFELLGEKLVKNIPEPVTVYRIMLDDKASALVTPVSREENHQPGRRRAPAAAALVIVLLAIGGGLWWQPWKPAIEPASVERMAFPLPDMPSIAVLPFDNLSGDPNQEYFADGIAEDLTTDLSKISGLFVIARNSAFAYKGKTVRPRQVAEELGVRYVLEGSVRRSGDKLRINVQLIDAASGGHIWADRYDGLLADVFGLQDRVSRKIVSVLAVQLTEGEEERVAHRETKKTEAYDAFLEGWQHYLRQNPENFRKAISLFEKALEMDPEYARAHAALAATYMNIWRRYWHAKVGLRYLHDPQFLAQQFLEKALLDPTPLAYQVAATVLSQQGQHAEAIAAAEQAIALDPNDADGYVALAGTLTLSGKPEEAYRLVKRAMRLNPHYPPSYLYELGIAEFGMEQFEKAAESLQRASALNPDDRWSSRLLLATYGLLDRKKDATDLRERVGKSWRGFDPLTVRSVAFWYPFKQVTDADRLAQGLRRAGVPD